MTYDVDFDDTGGFDVVVKATGVFTLKEFLEGRERVLNDPRFRSGINVLVDHSQLDLSTASVDEVREDRLERGSALRNLRAGADRHRRADLGGVRPRSDVAIADHRQLAENSVVVETVAEAEAWLASCL